MHEHKKQGLAAMVAIGLLTGLLSSVSPLHGFAQQVPAPLSPPPVRTQPQNPPANPNIPNAVNAPQGVPGQPNRPNITLPPQNQPRPLPNAQNQPGVQNVPGQNQTGQRLPAAAAGAPQGVPTSPIRPGAQPNPAGNQQPVRPPQNYVPPAPPLPEARILDPRENPFLKINTTEEEKRIAEKERIKDTLKEMLPEVTAKLQTDIDRLRSQLKDEIKKYADTSSEGLSSLEGRLKNGSSTATLGGPSSAPGSPSQKLPDKAKFIGCVNQKALYRDINQGFNFFYEGPEAKATGCTS